MKSHNKAHFESWLLLKKIKLNGNYCTVYKYMHLILDLTKHYFFNHWLIQSSCQLNLNWWFSKYTVYGIHVARFVFNETNECCVVSCFVLTMLTPINPALHLLHITYLLVLLSSLHTTVILLVTTLWPSS